MPLPSKDSASSLDRCFGEFGVTAPDDALGRAVQAIEAAAAFIDAEERIICANGKFLETFECRDVAGMNLQQALPRHSAGTSHPWPGAGPRGTGWAHRKVRTADGRWFLQRTIPFSSDGQRSWCAVVTFTPIESSTILDDRMKLLGASTQVVWWWDWDFDTGTISFEVDQRNMLGFEVTALPHTGPEFIALMHPDDLARVHIEIESCMAGRVHQWTGEHRLRMADGSWRWALSSGRLAEPDALGRATRMVGITIDINDRKRVADQMRRDSEILSQLREAVVCLDVQGRVLYWNEPAERKFGWPAKEVLGTVFVEHLKDAAIRRDVEQLLCRALAGEVVSGERQTLRKDGSPIWIEFSWSVFRDSIGATAGVIGVARDITYRKAAQVTLERNAAMLADAQRLETLGALAGGVAHEFNNILSVISGLTELALAKAADGRDSAEYHRRVKKAVDHGRDIVNRILSFSRYRDPLRTSVDVGELVTECERMVQAVAPSTVRLSTRIQQPCGPAVGDLHQLVQVVLNLVANAIHAIGARPGHIAITAHHQILDGTTLKSSSGPLRGQYVAIGVTDDGCGMDAETQGRIFDPFYTTKPRGEGTGLGLSVANAIVQGHGGAIDVKSELGHGTTITMYVPAMRESAAASA